MDIHTLEDIEDRIIETHHEDIFQEVVDAETLEGSDKTEKVGSYSATVFNTSLALNMGVSLLDMADEHSQEVADAISAIIQEDGSFVEIDGEEPFFVNRVLFIERIELEPKFRGKGLGLVIASYLIDSLGANLVVMKPHPIYRGAEEPTKKALQQGIKKLKAHWKKLGAVAVDKDYFAIDCSQRNIHFLWDAEKEIVVEREAK